MDTIRAGSVDCLKETLLHSTEPLADGCWALPKQLPAGLAEIKFGEKINTNTHTHTNI